MINVGLMFLCCSFGLSRRDSFLMWLTPTYLILFFGVLGSSRTASAKAIMDEEAKE